MQWQPLPLGLVVHLELWSNTWEFHLVMYESVFYYAKVMGYTESVKYTRTYVCMCNLAWKLLKLVYTYTQTCFFCLDCVTSTKSYFDCNSNNSELVKCEWWQISNGHCSICASYIDDIRFWLVVADDVLSDDAIGCVWFTPVHSDMCRVYCRGYDISWSSWSCIWLSER